jgi:hypothetical protein
MATPLTQFQEPGFFSQVQAVSSLFLLPGAVQVVALVGTGKATKSILQEGVTRDINTNVTDTLAHPAASITRVYSLSVFQYPTSSYTITGGAIDWTPSIGSTDPNIRPQAGQEYLIDYETNKVAADFKPQFFFGQSAVLAQYGDATPSHTLSLGANGAFGNGASIIVCRQLDPAQVLAGPTQTATEMRAALTDLELIDCDIVVPMLTDTNLWGDYLNHVSKMSSKLERKERMALLGLNETGGRIPVYGGSSWSSLMAGLVPNSGLQPSRLMVMNPGACKTTTKGTQYQTNGTYLAACLAGLMVNPNYDTATPMTFKNLETVDELIIPELSRAEKNTLTSIGVTVIEPNGAFFRVRRAVTADTTSIAAQEPSIVRAFDQVARQMRTALENRFIGTKITLSTPAAVASAVNTFLLNFVSSEIIAAYRNVQVQQNSTEPRQIDISFEALPIFPFLWGSLDITITLS